MTCSSWFKAQRSAVRSALAKISLEPVIFLAFFCSGMIGKEAIVQSKIYNIY